MSLKEKMTALADAVREKAELTDTLTIDEMTEAVNGLVVNGVDVDERTLTVTPSKSQQNFTSSSLGENAYYSSVTVNAIPDEYITTDDATAVSGDILSGKTAYVKGEKVTGTIPTVTSLLEGNVVTVPQGYIAETQTITVGTAKEAETYTPGTSDITIPADTYLSGEQVIKGDANLKAENIVEGVTLFGVEGNFKSIDTTDATAVPGDILEGKTAYVNGEKVTGTLTEKALEINPTKELQVFRASDEESDVFYSNVIVNAIPDEYITTDDATADESDILLGKTAYVKGKKITGVYTTPSMPPMMPPSVEGNVVTIFVGYNNAEQTITVGTAKGAETFTPGTSNITIAKGTYLSGAQTIKGDGNLTPENIKTGVSIFTVEGTFTSDANANASDIAKGKTAYVNGEKITGTATRDAAVSPMWEYESWKIKTNRPPCNTYNVPSRGDSSAYFGVLDGNLIYFGSSTPRKYDETINWTYVSTGNTYDYAALGDGKLYWLRSDSSYTATPLFPSLSGITQVGCMSWGTLCCTGSGALYGGGGNDLTKVRRVEYTREKDTDPIVYVNVSKILNCRQDYQNFWVITADGSLARGWLSKEAFDYGTGEAYAEIDIQSIADGNPFLNYYPQNVDEYGGDSAQTYELAFRTDGLWYRQAGTYYDETDRKIKRYSWNKANDPGLRKYDWLGYCSMIGSASYEGYDEETGRDIYKYSLKEYAVALHIDEQGRLWKIAPKGEIISTEYEYVNFRLTGFTITQVGEDTDWQCVAPVAVNGVGTPGRFNGVWGQKGGKVVNLMASNSDIVEITWEEYPVPISGKMICVEGNKMYFAPEGAIVDLTKAGGTY